jgi:hypothetical protein
MSTLHSRRSSVKGHGLSCLPQAPLLAHEYRKRGLHRPRTMLTIHNIAFQVGKQQGGMSGSGACVNGDPNGSFPSTSCLHSFRVPCR